MSLLDPLVRLPLQFRENAATARWLAGSDVAAHVWEEAARLAEEHLRAASLEPLSLTEAVDESGYSRSHLRRMLRDRSLPNDGTDAEPLILRKHLPRKPGFGVDQKAVQAASSRVQAARAVIRGEG